MSVYGGPLTFMHWSRVPLCDAVLDKHFEGYGTLQFMDAGELELAYDDDAHRLQGPSFWCCWSGPRTRFRAAPPARTWSHRHVAWRGPLLAHWQAEGLFPLPPISVQEGAAWAARFDELLELLGQTDRWSQRRAVNRLEGLLLDLAARQTAPERQPEWLRASLAELEAGCTETVDYTALAARHHMAASTFRRRFREATGLAPHAYLLQCRLERARRLLSESELSIKEIAGALGYSDVYYFSRHFREGMGTPPGEYRRSVFGHGGGEA